MKNLLLSSTLLFLSLFTFAQKPTKILLIGTFHFNNPGLDVQQQADFDILQPSVQQELELMSKKIAAFKPTEFFIESSPNEQAHFDSLYNFYLQGTYFNYIKNRFPSNTFYSQGEIFQLAFRVGKEVQLKTILGVDVIGNDFPYDSLKSEMEKANQSELIKAMETFPNFSNAKSLITRLLALNATAYRQIDRSWYITYTNRGGEPTNFVGAYLTSEWYKRNLYMYSLVQKLTTASDEHVVLLLGASHIALIEKFIKDDKRFEIVELKDILK